MLQKMLFFKFIAKFNEENQGTVLTYVVIPLPNKSLLKRYHVSPGFFSPSSSFSFVVVVVVFNPVRLPCCQTKIVSTYLTHKPLYVREFNECLFNSSVTFIKHF